MAKKSTFRTLAEAIYFNKLKGVPVPLDEVNHRKLTVSEIKKIIMEEFAKAKESQDTKAKEVDGWEDSELEQETEWMKSLNIKEFFFPKK